MSRDDVATGAPTVDAPPGAPGDEAALARPATRTAIRPAREVDDPAPRPPFAPGELIDDYVVGEVLGEGGMGIVLSARDPDLDRPVAIKVLRRGVVGPHELAHARARMLREAQAMARLSHPNVITVYRVGSVGDQLFIAMELVEGGTLRRWLAEPRSHAEIREAFLAAGRGLAAAHAAGLVHRDFKPDNVLVGRDGRVRVTDFGLAGMVGDRAAAPAPAGEEVRASPAAAAPLTHTGAVLGTPIYMAPEQHAGEHVDARADQFAFCVSLYEALYRERPFAGATYQALVESVMAGHVHRPEGDVVPPRLRALLLRGMAREPARRFASMDELLDELVRSGDGDRARGGLAAAAPADPALRERIASLGARVDEAHAAEQLGHLDRGLELAAAIAAEVDATGHGPLIAAHRLVLGKLHRMAERVDDAIAALRASAAEAVRAGDAVLEARALTELLSAVGEQRGDLRRADDLELAASSAVVRAGSAAEAVQLEVVAGSIDEAREHHADARAHLERARRLWQTRLAAEPAHRHLGGLVHARLGAVLETLDELEAAGACYARARELWVATLGPDHPGVADVDLNTGVLQMRLGDHARAHALAAGALAIYRGAYGEHHERVAHAHGNAGDALLHLGRAGDAFEAFEAALAIRRALYPAGSLELAGSLGTFGIAAASCGRAAEARAPLEEALAIRAAKLPAGHPGVGEAHQHLGAALQADGRLDEAVTHYAHASRIYAGHELPAELGLAEQSLGWLWFQRGDLPRALAHLERADAAWQRADPQGRGALNARFALGQVLWAAGHEARARELIGGLRAPGRDAVEQWLAERGA